jgi:hypothetical protein
MLTPSSHARPQWGHRASWALAASLLASGYAGAQTPPATVVLPNSSQTPVPATVPGTVEPAEPLQTPNPTTLFVPSVTTTLTETSNAFFGSGQGVRPRSDTLINVAPALLVKSISSSLEIDGNIILNGLYSADHTQVNHVTPEGSFDALAQLVPHTLFLDAGVTATQSLLNPFLGQSSAPTTLNTYSTEQFHLTPYVNREIAPDLTALFRSENVETTYSGAPVDTSLVNSYTRSDIASLGSNARR